MNVRKTLGFQLLVSVFSFYLFVTVVAAVTQMFIEWRHAEEVIRKDLEALQKSFESGIALAIWELSDEQIQRIAQGMIYSNAVTGVHIDGQRIQVHLGESGNIQHTFDILYREEGVERQLGIVAIYSSRTLILNRVKHSYISIVVNALFNTSVLWLIVLWGSHKLVTRPLQHFTEHIPLDFDNLEACTPIETERHPENEIKILEDAFNKMVLKLQSGRKRLKELNQTLELKVRQRTQELRESKERADAANQAKSTFLANMSHELRTPLNAILGYSQIMTRSQHLNPEDKKNLQVINRSGEHLLTLINDVLNLSKIEAGKIVLQETDCDLYRLMDEVRDLFTLRCEEKGLSLRCEREAEVPQYVNTDETRLRQILVNGLSNAMKFTDEGGVTVRLTCKPPPPDASDGMVALIFEIEDTGPGIQAEDLDHIFEPFVQDKSGLESHEGTGLGLPISRKFAQLMGGDITVKSQPGVGSLFTVEVLAYKMEQRDVPRQQVRRKVIALEPGHQEGFSPHYRILIVDDVQTNRQVLSTLLSPIGFEIREACNGREAIEVWKAWQPHVTWMDIRMPVLGGIEATKEIRQLTGEPGQHAIIIAISASSFDTDVEKILAAGCDDFVGKPFKESEIFDTLRKHLGIRYVYEEEERSTVNGQRSTVEEVVTPEMVAALPAEWLAVLRQGAEEADIKALLKVIEQIRERDAVVADALMKFVEDFEYDGILALL